MGATIEYSTNQDERNRFDKKTRGMPCKAEGVRGTEKTPNLSYRSSRVQAGGAHPVLPRGVTWVLSRLVGHYYDRASWVRLRHNVVSLESGAGRSCSLHGAYAVSSMYDAFRRPGRLVSATRRL